MNRNQFQTGASQGQAPKDDLFFSAEEYIFRTSQKQEDSDSGEDFDYGEEDEEEEEEAFAGSANFGGDYKPATSSDNFDLMNFITQMDVPG